MCQHEYNILLNYISLYMYYQLLYFEHVSKIKKISSVYYPSYFCCSYINSILYISISISIYGYIYIYSYIYQENCGIPSIILPNNSTHQHFIDLDDNHCLFSYLKYILKLLINNNDYLFILLLLSTFVISRHSFTTL